MAKTVKKASAKPKAAAEPRKSTAAKTKGNVTQMTISHEQVALLAHRFWNERGRQHGHHEEDWFRAEQALYQKAS